MVGGVVFFVPESCATPLRMGPCCRRRTQSTDRVLESGHSMAACVISLIVGDEIDIDKQDGAHRRGVDSQDAAYQDINPCIDHRAPARVSASFLVK
jgi:hypothetical protein